MWRLDMERFLEEPTLAFLKDRMEVQNSEQELQLEVRVVLMLLNI